MNGTFTDYESTKLLRTCGRTLLAAFVIAVAAVLFPLKLAEPSWGLRLSTSVVDAAALPLVALLLMRFAAELEYKSAKAKDLGGKKSHAKAVAYSPRRVRRLAFKGFVMLILLVIWQFILVFSSDDRIIFQSLELSRQFEARFKAAEESARILAGEDVSKALAQSPQGEPFPIQSESEIATQRSDILNRLAKQKKQVFQDIANQKTTAQFGLFRDGFRIILMAIVYAWGFYGIAKF